MILSRILLGDSSKVGLDNKPNRHTWIKKTLASIPAGESILDAGAGECQFKQACQHLIYTAQDFAQYDGSGDGKGIQTGNWDNTKLDIVSDITSIPVPDHSFENVMCIEVLEHLPDPVAALKELVRVLKPEGKLIITAPFASLTHFAPYHFATGFNQYFYSHWAEKLNLDVIELSFNGNYFEFLGQELRYSAQVGDSYANRKLSFLEKIAFKRVLSWLQKTSEIAKGSEELLAFGVHFVGKKIVEMILVRLQGGLGNQMFQYAFGKMLALKNRTALKLDLTLLNDRTPSENVVFRNYDLDIFNIIPVFASKKEVAFFNGYPSGTIFQRAFFKLSKLLFKRNLVIQKKHEFQQEHLSLPDATCIVGRWQSPLYFKDILKEISNDFYIKDSFLLNSSYSEEILMQDNAVSVHIRRGDYTSNSFYNENIGALDISYYKAAFSYICSQVSHPVFYVFSDDIEWCRENIHFLPTVIFVKTEKSKKGMAEDMKLISLCKHHIISNSTFSWWGAYLCNYEEKVIVAPEKWSSSLDFTPPCILPDNWKKI